LILPSHLRLGLPGCLYPPRFPTKLFECNFHAFYMHCQSHPATSLPDHIFIFWQLRWRHHGRPCIELIRHRNSWVVTPSACE
jgi:hypothetical protein